MEVDRTGLEPGSQGERGYAGTREGTNNPYKHCREYNPPRLGHVRCRDPRTGKWKDDVPHPAAIPFPGPSKLDGCDGSCAAAAIGVCIGVIACILQPEICIPLAAGGAAAAGAQ
jgi:hypothetical protein